MEADRWLGLDLRHLIALKAIADEGSFGRAAEKLGDTQSAVSQQIATLERIVGLQLVERPGGPRPVSLTEAGEKPAVAEAHAMALKEFVMETVATTADIRGVREEIQGVRAEIEDLRDEIGDVRGEIKDIRSEIKDIRSEAKEFRDEVRQEFTSLRKEFDERFATKDELRHEIGLLRKDVDAMGLKLTVRMGGMLAIAVGAVATLGRIL